jgi:hypothetical protein
MMRCSLIASMVYITGAHLAPLKDMAFHAAWGAANDKKYGKTFGEWDGHKARHASHLDALNEALEEAPVVKYLDLLISSASWGAANERAFGRHRSGAQVDWDMFHEHGRKVKSLVGNDAFVDSLIESAKSMAWYAANKFYYGESNEHTTNDLRAFKEWMDKSTKSAPAKWPMKDVQEMFRYAALAAASHRVADQEKRKKQNKDHQFHLQYEDTPDREDWKDYHKHAVALKKELGYDQAELFEQLEGMVVEAAWATTCERTHGKHSNDAKVHWRKHKAHQSEARGLYKGQAKFDDIDTMIINAAWGAANERAFGQGNDDARTNWREFENAASRIAGSHGGEL